MKIAIVPNDNVIVIDGAGARLDLADLRAGNIHAVQFDDERGFVEVEYVRPANERLTVEEFNTRFGASVSAARDVLKAEADARAAALAEALAAKAAAEALAEAETHTLRSDEVNPDPALAHG